MGSRIKQIFGTNAVNFGSGISRISRQQVTPPNSFIAGSSMSSVFLKPLKSEKVKFSEERVIGKKTVGEAPVEYWEAWDGAAYNTNHNWDPTGAYIEMVEHDGDDCVHLYQENRTSGYQTTISLTYIVSYEEESKRPPVGATRLKFKTDVLATWDNGGYPEDPNAEIYVNMAFLEVVQGSIVRNFVFAWNGRTADFLAGQPPLTYNFIGTGAQQVDLPAYGIEYPTQLRLVLSLRRNVAYQTSVTGHLWCDYIHFEEP